MKKLFALLLALVLALSLAACGGGSDPKPSGSSGTNDTPPASTQQNDPGTTQTDDKGGSTKKADNGQMEDDPDNSHYDSVEKLSGIPAIGNPVGYTYAGNADAGDDVQFVTFEAQSGTVADGDIETYAAALWNLSIDIADDGMLCKYNLFTKEATEFETLSDARRENGSYAWYYFLDETVVLIGVKLDDNKDNRMSLEVRTYNAE
ncbi:MAG: hypothetical protein LIP16_15330 [Clostridium sp.]|nr:hypothetical protein [Clostridium sp.]